MTASHLILEPPRKTFEDLVDIVNQHMLVFNSREYLTVRRLCADPVAAIAECPFTSTSLYLKSTTNQIGYNHLESPQFIDWRYYDKCYQSPYKSLSDERKF